MKRIFTTRFFGLSTHDQAAVVEAALKDIEKNYGRYTTPEDEKRARQRAQRIRKKAVKCGILKGCHTLPCNLVAGTEPTEVLPPYQGGEPEMNGGEREQQVEDIVSRMKGNDLIDFAEEHCDWYESDYYEDCVSDRYGGWVPADGSDYSIVDAAMDVIREWAMDDDNFRVLQEYAKKRLPGS